MFLLFYSSHNFCVSWTEYIYLRISNTNKSNCGIFQYKLLLLQINLVGSILKISFEI